MEENKVDGVLCETVLLRKHHDEIEKIQFKRFNLLTVEERESFVHKVMNKYRSEEYRQRWAKRGYETPDDLLWFIYDYANEYGFHIQEDIYEPFLTDYIGFDSFIVKRYDGQGSFVVVEKYQKGDIIMKNINNCLDDIEFYLKEKYVDDLSGKQYYDMFEKLGKLQNRVMEIITLKYNKINNKADGTE